MVSSKENFLGVDTRGNMWFEKILDNGKQLWVKTRNNIIQNAGINDEIHVFNEKTGLSALSKPGR